MAIRQHHAFASPIEGRGYHALYRAQEVNHCPGCGRTQWIVGRVSAECVHCSAALPLAENTAFGHGSRLSSEIRAA